MSLRSTIFEIQTRDKELSEIASDRETFLAGWRSDVEQLYQVLMKMLEDLAAEGSIEFREGQKQIKESEIGEYHISELILMVANRAIVASPVARLVSGGTGRVDLYRRDRPTESDRIRLLRRLDVSAQENWFIEERPVKNPVDKFITIQASPL